jgi:hypothetical protein
MIFPFYLLIARMDLGLLQLTVDPEPGGYIQRSLASDRLLFRPQADSSLAMTDHWMLLAGVVLTTNMIDNKAYSLKSHQHHGVLPNEDKNMVSEQRAIIVAL